MSYKRTVMLLLVLSANFLARAQRVTEQNLIGKWFLNKQVINGDVIIDMNDPMAAANFNLKGAHRRGAVTKEDSLRIVKDCMDKMKDFDKVFLEFLPQGKMRHVKFLRGGQAVADTPTLGTYSVDLVKGVLVTTENGKTDTFQASMEGGKLVMIVESPGMSFRMEFVKKKMR